MYLPAKQFVLFLLCGILCIGKGFAWIHLAECKKQQTQGAFAQSSDEGVCESSSCCVTVIDLDSKETNASSDDLACKVTTGSCPEACTCIVCQSILAPIGFASQFWVFSPRHFAQESLHDRAPSRYWACAYSIPLPRGPPLFV